MYEFSEKSLSRLNTCHQDIIEICKELIQVYDFSVLEGHRTLEKQQEHYKAGRSKLDGIKKKSKHQSYPSMAIDIMPYVKGTNAFSGNVKDNARFYMMMSYYK
jgi:peptidoglycan L-alanyl-D-glutamate endopeptidase CwlK